MLNVYVIFFWHLKNWVNSSICVALDIVVVAGNMKNKTFASTSPVAVGINMHSETVSFLKMSSSTVIYCGQKAGALLVCRATIFF